ncbi:hypothetical protein V2J09_017135 [Rumex salicifolius]
MGCKVSKVEDLPLVVICKKRKDLLRAAADHRYALAVAHMSYFTSLRDVGDALHRFVDEDLLVLSASSTSPSSLSSPVLTLPSDDDKSCGDGSRKQRRRKPGRSNDDFSSSSTSLSHSISNGNAMNRNKKWNTKKEVEFREGEETEDSEIYFSSIHSKGSSSSGHAHARRKRRSPKPGISYSPVTPMLNYSNYFNPDYLYENPYNGYDSSAPFYPSGNSSYGAYYMKKDSARIPSVIYEEAETTPIYSYSDYDNAGTYGFEFVPIPSEYSAANKQEKQQKKNLAAPIPPSPQVSPWDYFNPFEGFDDNTFSGYYVNGGTLGYDSDKASSDLREVRAREGIPDLEEDSATELFKNDANLDKKKKKKKNKSKNKDRSVHFGERGSSDFVEGNFNTVPLQQWQQMPKPETTKPYNTQQQHMDPEKETPTLTKEMTGSSLSSDLSVPVSVDEVWMKEGSVSYEMDEPSQPDLDSSRVSSLTTLSVHGTRDLREVVGEVKDEFDAAIDFGNEVCHLLEVGKLPYQPKTTFLSGMLARMPCPVEESVSATQPQPRSSISSNPDISKMRRAYVCDLGDDVESLDPSLVSTLDKLYVWEKKLYKEVKDEEKLRITYEKKCKQVKLLVSQGADASKIEATEESIKQLLTRINLSIRTVDAIARKIHQIRDKELQPQLRDLILGLRRMWRLMLKCHQKQLQAIVQTKITKLKGNTGSYEHSSARATAQLQMEVLNWCNRFKHLVELQKSYVKSLNAWLLSYIDYQPEHTPDGPPPYSPGQLGTPPVFIICHDWMQAMERISKSGISETVQTAMKHFASILDELCVKQDAEQCHRLQAEHAMKEFERQTHTVGVNDVMDEKGGNLSLVPSDLESVKRRVKTEITVHKEAVKVVHAAVFRSIKSGFIPIFEALESFTAQAVKAYDDVRVNG